MDQKGKLEMYFCRYKERVMKLYHYFLGLFLLILSLQTCFAQLNPDSLGIDDDPLVNSMEARYFNIQVQHYRGDFDFRGKRVGLFLENNGKHMLNKKEYFDNWAREHLKSKDFGQNQLRVLSVEERELSKGFDAIIVSWSDKKITEARWEQLIKKLRKFTRLNEIKQSPF